MRIRLLLLVILLGMATVVWKRTVGQMSAPAAPAAPAASPPPADSAAPGGPFAELAPCRDGYRAARSAADTARVDARQVTLTPLLRGAPASGATPYTCGIWRLEMPEALRR